MNNWFDNIIKSKYNTSLGFEWREYYVFDLNFKGDTVKAYVRAYSDIFFVTITFRQFSVHENHDLMLIANKPEVKLDLLKGRIPDILFNSGVNIFPTSLIDFITSCSCGGAGFLCNEVMAVLNRLNEIFEQNPFLIFSLKGLDLTKINSFPVKKFNDLFNNSYNRNLSFLIDKYLYDSIDVLMNRLNYLIETYDFISSSKNLKMPLNLNSKYQITNNSFKNNGELISSLIGNPILDYAFELVKNHKIIPEIFKLDDEHVYTRWIPSEEIKIDVEDELVEVDGETLSKTDQLFVLVSLIVEDLISILFSLEDDDYYKEDIFQLLFKSSEIDSNNKRSLVNDISRNLSIYNINYTYQINIRNVDNEFVFDFEMDDDEDKLQYLTHIRKLFHYFRIYWNLNESLRLNKKEFMKYLKKVEKYLDDLNVNVNKSFIIYDSIFRIKLTLNDNDFLTIKNISNYHWMIDLGNCLISAEEFRRLKIDNSGLVKINEDYYFINPVKIKSLQNDVLFLPTNFESYELLQIALLGRYRNLKFDIDDQFKQLLNFQGKLLQPTSLKGELRPYQVNGYSWLVQNIKSGFGSILADDMGLGKTIQTLATILYLKENNMLNNQQILIVVPTTLITNWTNEIDKFTDLTYSIYHGSEREFSEETDLILTTYGMVRIDEKEFKKKTWFLCVIDEAQNIKNPNSKQTRAIKTIKASHRIALTGTPIENHLLDYWSIFDFTNKGYLKSVGKFKKEYVTPINKNTNSRVLNNLKTITRPFILRRLKTDESIIDDLPDKIVNDIYCKLTDKQSKLYNELMKNGMDKLDNEKSIKRKGQILKLITSLKQVCNHPAQYLKKGKVNVKDSSKLELLIDILTNILDVDEKVIIFTQYKEMGEIIQNVCLKKFNRNVLFLHGSLNSQSREEIINNFQKDKSYPILIATLKTGGVGLNLTSAQNVIHYDLWWNPAVENQATDRTYRIGQENDVMVYRFITKGTFEENIDLILKNKLKLFDKAIANNETFITELSDEELKKILELRL